MGLLLNMLVEMGLASYSLVSFAQKQEVRQVYVRSTARVYEIYSSQTLGTSNEYLCTVRCGIATRDDEVLHATGVEPIGANLKESSGQQERGNCSCSEDDWVEVKVQDMSLKDDRLNLMRERNGANPRANLQDLYEATAEFTDSDACTSLTLHLLSLQSKDWISIDEIYVFADPAESVDSEAQAAPIGNLATTSLMSTLVPTLLQLSKSSNAQKQELHAPSTSGKGEYLDVGSKVNHSTNSGNELEQEVKEAVTKPPDVCITEQEWGTGQRYKIVTQADAMSNCIESVLEQLVSRVSRIEDICLRFEENMLNPIKSMDRRLQLVEEQLQELVKNSQHSKLPTYTRISAPEFSCGESNSSSLYSEGNQKLPSYTKISAPEFSCGESNSSCFCTEGNEIPCFVELENKDAASGKVPNSSNARSQPGLVISAPDFLCHDDVKNFDGDDVAKDDAIGQVINSPQEKPKRAMSIDDALAAALFGFMANSSSQPAHCTQALPVKAPEFRMEKNGDDDKVAKQHENPFLPSIFLSELDETEGKDGIVSTLSSGDDGRDKLVSDCVDCLRSEADVELAQTDDSQIGGPTGVGEPYDEIIYPVSVKNDGLDVVSENTEVEVGKGISENTVRLVEKGDSQNFDSTGVGAPSDEATITISVPGTNEIVEKRYENTEVESEKSILDNSFDSPRSSCVVDFELPILDVKFTSTEFVSISSLEALFDNRSEFATEASSMEQKNEDGKNDSISNIPID